MRVDFVLPYRPITGQLFDRKGGRCAIGWLLEELIGREQFSEFRTSDHYREDPIVLLKEVTGAKIDAAFLRDLDRINGCDEFGSKNALGFITAFAMLPDFLKEHRPFFESFSSRVDATLEKIENVMVPDQSDSARKVFFGTRLMEQPLSAYLEGETCSLRLLTPIMVWN